MMDMQRAVCGIYECVGCEHQSGGECPGCVEGNLQLRKSCEQVCAVFECVETRGIAACSECDESSCVLKRSVESVCPMRSRYENMRWWAGRMARAMEAKKGSGGEADKVEKISARVVNRLRWYLTALDGFAKEGATSVSSWRLAERVGVNAALIRKDLSRFGDFGTPSFGYRVDYLTQKIRDILHLDQRNGVIWVGAACFRLHFPSVSRLGNHACVVAGVFDSDPEEIGTFVGGIEVLPLEKLEEVVSASGVHTATLALPGPEARIVAEKLADLGIKAILNVSGEMLALPDSVRVSSFDLVGELLELCYYCAPG
jgi:redox-sensing transcriptional repressor